MAKKTTEKQAEFAKKRNLPNGRRGRKSADRLEKTLRIWQMISGGHRYYTLKDLALEFGCSEKTVYRELKLLRSIGVDYKYEPAVHRYCFYGVSAPSGPSPAEEDGSTAEQSHVGGPEGPAARPADVDDKRSSSIKVELEVAVEDADGVASLLGRPTQRVRLRLDGTVRLKFRVGNLDEIENLVLACSHIAPIVRPPELRDRIISRLRRALEQQLNAKAKMRR